MKRNIGLLVALLIMALIYFYYHSKGNAYKNAILQNPGTDNALIKEVSFINKRGYRIEYTFSLNGNIYNSDSYRSNFSLNKAVVGKSFPLVYNKAEPEKHEILITPDDFKEYNIAFPDSLSWVFQYIK